MPTFEKGDIVQVDYKSPKLIEQWMNGERVAGMGDVGVVKYSISSDFPGDRITVTFPMLGTFGLYARDLKILQKAEK